MISHQDKRNPCLHIPVRTQRLITFVYQLNPNAVRSFVPARVDSQNTIIMLAPALVTIFAVRSTGIGTSTLSRCLGYRPLTPSTPQGAELCRYMMQPLEKIQSPRVPHSQGPIHTDFRNVVVSLRNSSTTYETNVLPQRQIISSLHDTSKTADPPDPILQPLDSLHSHSHQTLPLRPT